MPKDLQQFKDFLPDFIIEDGDHRSSKTGRFPALLAFKTNNFEVVSKFIKLGDESRDDRRGGYKDYEDLDRGFRVLFRPVDSHRDAVTVSFHKKKMEDSYVCYFDVILVDWYGEYTAQVTEVDQIEKARELCLEFLVKEGLISEELSSYVNTQTCLRAKNIAIESCGIDRQMLEKAKSNIKRSSKNLRAMIWLESSLTVFHIEHMAQLSRALQKKGYEVFILTSEDTMAKFYENGGKLNADGRCETDSQIDFGQNGCFLPLLPSQTTYNKRGKKVKNNWGLEPFDFIGSRYIIKLRRQIIKDAIEQIRPDELITSLWPSGYGPFTNEVKAMLGFAVSYNLGCRLYSLSNDIPYLDYNFNYPRQKATDFEIVHRTFVRGDGTIKLESDIPLSSRSQSRINYVGHFYNPLPPRQKMHKKNRKVLVTYGTRESNWSGPSYQSYFEGIINLAPDTLLRKQPWEIVVGPDCAEEIFSNLVKQAESVSASEEMKIKVRRGVPDKAFLQEIANAAFRICQYDIFILDEVSSGVPALITVGEVGMYTCGARDGESRIKNLESIGAPVSRVDQYFINVPTRFVAKIDQIYEKSLSNQKFSLPSGAPERVAEIIFEQQQFLHRIASKYGFKHKLLALPEAGVDVSAAPDPVVSKVSSVTLLDSVRRRFLGRP